MVSVLLLSLVSVASASEVTVNVRAPEGDFVSVAMEVSPVGVPPLALPARFSPPADSRRKASPYVAETRIEPMGASFAVAVQVFTGEGDKRVVVLESNVMVAPASSASYRLALGGKKSKEWALDVKLDEPAPESSGSAGAS